MISKNLLLLPEKLRQLRLRRRLDQKTVSEKGIVSHSGLCAIEKARRIASPEQVERIGIALACRSEEVAELKALAAHDQIVELVAKRYGLEHAEMLSLVLQAKATLSQDEKGQITMGKITSLLRQCITAKHLLADPGSKQ